MFQSLLIWGTYIWGVLLFEWILIFEKSVAILSRWVLIFVGYLYSMGTYTPENTVCSCFLLHAYIILPMHS